MIDYVYFHCCGIAGIFGKRMYNKSPLSDIGQLVSVNHFYYLGIACEQGNLAKKANEMPAGAVLVKAEEIGADSAQLVVSKSHEQCQALDDPIATAEMDCIRRAGRRNDQSELTLYTSRYPDMLCAGTLLQFSIGALVIGLPATESPALNLLSEKGLSVSFVPHSGCEQLQEEIYL